MTIQILPDDRYMVLSNDAPAIGRIYALEDAATGTLAQSKAFHALAQEYWKSGAHSYPARDFPEFKNCLKRALGAGFEAFVYVDMIDGRAVIRDAKRYEDVPKLIRDDPNRRELIRGRLRSYADYTKKERSELNDRLMAEMLQAGVNSKKFFEILAGLEAAKVAHAKI